MRTLRLVASVVGVLALTSCGSDGNDVIEFDGQCDGTYEVLPPEVGDPPSRTRVVIDAFCELGSLGDFDVQTFQFVDDNGDGTADLTASTIYTDAFGNELFSDFAGTSSADRYGGHLRGHGDLRGRHWGLRCGDRVGRYQRHYQPGKPDHLLHRPGRIDPELTVAAPKSLQETRFGNCPRR